MRKTTVVSLILVAVLGVGVFVFLSNPFAVTSGLVEGLSIQFMEDLKYKDFRDSALYHHKLERDRVDIGRTLEKLFLIKPEFLDIREFHIVKVDVDHEGGRARVHLRTKYQRLNQKKEPEDGEVILYWMKRNPDCPIGASCEKGSCVALGETLYKPDPKKKDNRPRREKDLGDDPEAKASAEQFRCDPMAEDQWFMNLDSTLKEKRYNY